MAIQVIDLTSLKPIDLKTRMKIRSMSGLIEIQNMVGGEFVCSNMATLTCHMDETVDKKTGEIVEEKNYERYIFINNDNNMYVTSSPTFKDDMRMYLDEMFDSDECSENAQIRVRILEYKSQNNSGKFFKAEVIDIE